MPQYEHDESVEDLEVSEGQELDTPELYTNRLDEAAGAYQESIDELMGFIEKQDHQETERTAKLVQAEFEGLVLLAKKINEKLEAEIKEKYQLLKDQQRDA